jgi:uncharacterized membrane protein YuzA (DUF378 family)
MNRPLDVISFVLVIIGAINWLLVGLFRFDLAAALAGREFGEVGAFNAIVYVLVGLAAIVQIALRSTRRPIEVGHDRPTKLYPR